MFVFFNRLLQFFLLALVQVLVCNHIYLFDVATPLLYLYFFLTLPARLSRNSSMLWGFSFGFLMDFFTNTPGLAATTLTLLAFTRPYLLSFFTRKEKNDDLIPSVRTLNWNYFIRYLFTGTLCYSAVFYTLEAFSPANFTLLLTKIIATALLTTLLFIGFEVVRKP